MASGEQDLARVAVGEILDSAPSDVRALLAQLELAFLDGRADEFGRALEQLAHAVDRSASCARPCSRRARVLAAHHNDSGARGDVVRRRRRVRSGRRSARGSARSATPRRRRTATPPGRRSSISRDSSSRPTR